MPYTPTAFQRLLEPLDRRVIAHAVTDREGSKNGPVTTSADDIAEYYLANYYDQVKSWIADRKARVAV